MDKPWHSYAKCNETDKGARCCMTPLWWGIWSCQTQRQKARWLLDASRRMRYSSSFNGEKNSAGEDEKSKWMSFLLLAVRSQLGKMAKFRLCSFFLHLFIYCVCMCVGAMVWVCRSEDNLLGVNSLLPLCEEQTLGVRCGSRGLYRLSHLARLWILP